MNPRADRSGQVILMKLTWKKNKPILMIAPNFTVILNPSQIKYITVNDTKYAIVYIDGDPIHMEPIQ
jgi:hypothetical protein